MIKNLTYIKNYKNCFTCAKANYCLRTWEGYNNPNDFICNDYKSK